MKKISQIEAENLFKENSLELLSNYVNNQTQVTAKCFCGKIYKTIPFQVFQKFKVSCGCNKRISKENLEKRLLKRNLKLLSCFNSSYDKISVKCFCGKIFTMSAYSKQESCGCLHRVPKEEVLRRFKKYGLILLSEFSNVTTTVSAKCFCGKIFKVIPGYVFSGGTSSCGCKADKKGSSHHRWTGWQEIPGAHWTRIKKEAMDRNINFNVTIQQAWKIFIKQNKKCNLSGVPIYFYNTTKNIEKTASLDRIDNNKGYELDNVQWVHKTVNLMKGKFDEEYFISLCKLVANPLKIINNNLEKINKHHTFKGVGLISRTYWNKIKNRCSVNNMDFLISIEQAWDVFLSQKGKCHYTGELLTGDNMSLDRIDSNKGYVTGNIQWVTKDINFVKNNLIENTFLDFCSMISKHRK